MRLANILQPKQKPRADSKNAKIIRIIRNVIDNSLIPNTKKSNIRVETARPIA